MFKGPASERTILSPQHSIDELNDLIQYYPWNFWDQLVLRATEGVSGLIPRQEYELLSFANAWLRWPEFMLDMTHHAGGLQGVVELGRKGRVPASKINMLHIWCLGIVTLLGRAVYLIMDREKPGEHLPELNAAMKFWEALAYGYRGDGYILGSQNRYTQRNLDDDWADRLVGSRIDFPDGGSDFRSLMAAAELLAFYVHFDCRLGMMDLGPYIQDNGNPVIVRNAFLREEAYPWSMPCDGLPYAMTFVFEVDAEKAGLQELRCIDIGTLMTKPYDYVSGICTCSATRSSMTSALVICSGGPVSSSSARDSTPTARWDRRSWTVRACRPSRTSRSSCAVQGDDPGARRRDFDWDTGRMRPG